MLQKVLINVTCYSKTHLHTNLKWPDLIIKATIPTLK